MMHAVHIFPRLPDDNAIEGVRSNFDPLHGLIPPHITLVFPFRLSSSVDELIKAVTSAAKTIAPFSVSFGAAELHEGGYVWLPVREGNQSIEALRVTLYEAIDAAILIKDKKCEAHLTVARVSIDDESAALLSARSIKNNFTVIVDNLVVERIEPDENSTVLAEISLATKQAEQVAAPNP